MKNFLKRSYKIYRIIGFLFILELIVLFYHSGIIEGLDQRADKLKKYATVLKDDETILPGDFYDRNGELLVETSLKTIIEIDKNGNEKNKLAKTTVYKDGKAYSQLIGYTGSHTVDLSTKDIKNVVGSRADYRLMAFLDEDYWGKNGLYTTVGIHGTKGQSATLTLEHNLQLEVYHTLKKQMNESLECGSAVVMDAKTGEILSMVSFPTYDFNHLSVAIEEMKKAERETKLEPGYPITYKRSIAPGSIFKILMAVSLIDHNMENFTVTDTSFMVNGWKCKNAYTSYGDNITYYEGIERSSNVFFAQAALALGTDRLNETAEKFMLCKDNSYLSLNFGNMQYHWDLNVEKDILTQTGFGQGKVELTTVHAAMITQAIANDGVMMKPYLVQKLTDANGTVVYTEKPKRLSKATSKNTADKVTRAMLSAARYSSIHYKGLKDTAEIFEKYQIAGKTGTAQTGDNKDSNNAWFISFAPADKPQYVVVVNQCKTKKAGYKMMITAASIYKYLFEKWQQ